MLRINAVLSLARFIQRFGGNLSKDIRQGINTLLTNLFGVGLVILIIVMILIMFLIILMLQMGQDLEKIMYKALDVIKKTVSQIVLIFSK